MIDGMVQMETGNHTDGAATRPPEDHGGEARVLRRPTDDRVLFGVASGLGRYLGIDPVAVRIAFVLLTVFGGSGVILYVIGLVAIPEGDGDAIASPSAGGRSAAIAIGAALVAVGAINLAGQLLPGMRALVGPLLLLTAGILVIMWSGRR